MQLSPGERSILAYFPTTASAQMAVQELKNAGYETVQFDRISRFGVENDPEINYAVAGRRQSITGLTLFSADVGNRWNADAQVLMGAEPSVSGYGDTNYGIAGGHAFLVTVVTTEDKVDQAVNILKNHGAQV